MTSISDYRDRLLRFITTTLYTDLVHLTQEIPYKDMLIRHCCVIALSSVRSSFQDRLKIDSNWNFWSRFYFPGWSYLVAETTAFRTIARQLPKLKAIYLIIILIFKLGTKNILDFFFPCWKLESWWFRDGARKSSDGFYDPHHFLIIRHVWHRYVRVMYYQTNFSF